MTAFLVLSTVALLQAAAEPQPPPRAPLPRSSIAAVLARRDELGLTPEQVRQLQQRDDALQKERAELREQLAPPAQGRAQRSTGADGGSPEARSPSSAAIPDPAGSTFGAGGHGHRGTGDPRGRASAGKVSPELVARAVRLRDALNDADTAAWLGAEEVLREDQRERARAVAARFRELLADEQEKGPRRQ